jgi:hypothetical protein
MCYFATLVNHVPSTLKQPSEGAARCPRRASPGKVVFFAWFANWAAGDWNERAGPTLAAVAGLRNAKDLRRSSVVDALRRVTLSLRALRASRVSRYTATGRKSRSRIVLVADYLEIDPRNRRPHPRKEESKLSNGGVGDQAVERYDGRRWLQ